MGKILHFNSLCFILIRHYKNSFISPRGYSSHYCSHVVNSSRGHMATCLHSMWPHSATCLHSTWPHGHVLENHVAIWPHRQMATCLLSTRLTPVIFKKFHFFFIFFIFYIRENNPTRGFFGNWLIACGTSLTY
jgi:hypothetical protein